MGNGPGTLDTDNAEPSVHMRMNLCMQQFCLKNEKVKNTEAHDHEEVHI